MQDVCETEGGEWRGIVAGEEGDFGGGSEDAKGEWANGAEWRVKGGSEGRIVITQNWFRWSVKVSKTLRRKRCVEIARQNVQMEGDAGEKKREERERDRREKDDDGNIHGWEEGK